MTTIHKTTSLIIAALMLSLSMHAQQVVQNRTYESGEQEHIDSLGSISTSGSVVAKPESFVQWEATSEIHITPGFHAQPGARFTASVFDPFAVDIIVLGGDNQSASPGAINPTPFDIAVWKYDVPAINLPVMLTIVQGGGSLIASPTDAGGGSLTLMTAALDGSVQAWFKQPVAANVTSIIQVTAGGKSILLRSYNFTANGSNGGGNGTGESGNGSGSGDPNAPGNSNGNAPNWNLGKERDNAAGFVVFQPATY